MTELPIEATSALQATRAMLSVKEDLNQVQKELFQLKKELSEVVYLSSGLYDRWVVEHQHVSRREAEMLRSIDLYPIFRTSSSMLQEPSSHTFQAIGSLV